jgi:hypothetical protein
VRARKADAKFCTTACRSNRRYLPPVRFHHGFADCQAKADPSGGRFGLAPREFLEQALLVPQH